MDLRKQYEDETGKYAYVIGVGLTSGYAEWLETKLNTVTNVYLKNVSELERKIDSVEQKLPGTTFF